MISVAAKTKHFFEAFPAQLARKGQVLIEAHEAPNYVYYLVKGEVREYSISSRGDEVVVNQFRAGSFFLMSWAINREPNPYFFEASSPLTYRAAPPDAVVAFIKENPDVMYDLLSRVYRGTDGLLGRMVRLMSGTAEQRLLYELNLQKQRHCDVQTNNNVFVPINESKLATLTGLSRETVNREMRKLITANIVEASRQGIRINDVAELEQRLITT